MEMFEETDGWVKVFWGAFCDWIWGVLKKFKDGGEF
jgi:hypothetical protein